MNYHTHVVAGGIVGCVASYSTDSLQMTSIMIATGVIGSLAPDIDHSGSYIGNRLPVISHIIHLVFGHRGFFHSMLGTIMATVITTLAFNATLGNITGYSFPYIVFFLGYLSHLALDFVTPGGIPLFWPYSKRITINKVATSSITERLVVQPIGLLVFGLLFYFRYSNFN